MDQQRASGAPITATLAGQPRQFRRLSRRDFATLMGKMPCARPDERHLIPIFDVHRWAGTPEGAVEVLALAAGVEVAEASTWGSLVQQTVTAQVITGESLTTGEEATGSEGENRADPIRGRGSTPGITPTRP